jgi:hypothetical protein
VVVVTTEIPLVGLQNIDGGVDKQLFIVEAVYAYANFKIRNTTAES